MSNANQVKCFRAQYQVLSKSNALDRTHKYRAEIAERLWEVATASSSYLDWETADASGRLAFQLDGPAKSQTRLFNALSLAGPRTSLRVREWLIRLTKP